MKEVDFSKIEAENVEGQKFYLNVKRELGNLLYMQGQNIEECELGRTIYLSEEAIEIDDKQKAIIKRYISTYPYVAKTAIEKSLEQ